MKFRIHFRPKEFQLNSATREEVPWIPMKDVWEDPALIGKVFILLAEKNPAFDFELRYAE